MISLIPDYRLPKNIIREEVDSVKNLGVEIKLNHTVDDAVGLLDRGYDAVFIATGAHKSRKLGIRGEDLTGVYDAIEFLRNEQIRTEGTVVVIGGGNSAIDSARVALRRGACEVRVLYRRNRDEMPAIPEEIEAAEAEGIRLDCLVLPIEILSKAGSVTSLKCVRMELKGFDRDGRRTPKPIEGSDHLVQADAVVVAIGQRPDPPVSGDSRKLITEKEAISVNPRTLQTHIPAVFAGGDAVGGEGTVIEAIAAGQRAALSIRQYFEGTEMGSSLEREIEKTVDVPLPDEEKEIKQKPRVAPRLLELKRRISSLDECVASYSKEEAVEEASRCLRCDIRETKQMAVIAEARNKQ